MKGKMCYCGFSVFRFAFALGIVWALGIFLMGLASMQFDWGTAMVELFASLYIGYKATFIGSVVGAVWGFFDAFIGGAVFAWFYNCLGLCGKQCEVCVKSETDES